MKVFASVVYGHFQLQNEYIYILMEFFTGKYDVQSLTLDETVILFCWCFGP